jgi:hypothetical protein
MGSLTYVVVCRDGQSSPPGTRTTGLTPTWVHLKRLSDNTNVTPQPAISEIGQGQYKFTYDPETSGEAAGQIDFGSGLTAPADRYADVVLRRGESRLIYSLPTETPGAEGGLPILDEFGQVAARVFDYVGGLSPGEQILNDPTTRLVLNAGSVIVDDYSDNGRDELLGIVGEAVLANPANKLLTDTNGFVTATNGGGGAAPTAVEIRQEMDANSTKLDNLDVAVSSRLASNAYTAPANADVAAIKAKTDNLPTSPAAVGSAMTLANNAVNAAAIAPDAGTELAAALLGTALGTGEWASVTVADALKAAWADGYGKVVLDLAQQKLFLYAPDGTTLVKTFNLNSATAPTSRIPA